MKMKLASILVIGVAAVLAYLCLEKASGIDENQTEPVIDWIKRQVGEAALTSAVNTAIDKEFGAASPAEATRIKRIAMNRELKNGMTIGGFTGPSNDNFIVTIDQRQFTVVVTEANKSALVWAYSALAKSRAQREYDQMRVSGVPMKADIMSEVTARGVLETAFFQTSQGEVQGVAVYSNPEHPDQRIFLTEGDLSRASADNLRPSAEDSPYNIVDQSGQKINGATVPVIVKRNKWKELFVAPQTPQDHQSAIENVYTADGRLGALIKSQSGSSFVFYPDGQTATYEQQLVEGITAAFTVDIIDGRIRNRSTGAYKGKAIDSQREAFKKPDEAEWFSAVTQIYPSDLRVANKVVKTIKVGRKDRLFLVNLEDLEATQEITGALTLSEAIKDSNGQQEGIVNYVVEPYKRPRLDSFVIQRPGQERRFQKVFQNMLVEQAVDGTKYIVGQRRGQTTRR